MTITEQTETDQSNDNPCMGTDESEYEYDEHEYDNDSDAPTLFKRKRFKISLQFIEMTQDADTACYLEMPSFQEEKPLSNMFMRIESVMNTQQLKQMSQQSNKIDSDPLNLIDQDINLNGMLSPFSGCGEPATR